MKSCGPFGRLTGFSVALILSTWLVGCRSGVCRHGWDMAETKEAETSVSRLLAKKYRKVDKEKKLLECNGDCDRDADCRGVLKCWKKQGEVPGCKGSRHGSRVQYCYRPEVDEREDKEDEVVVPVSGKSFRLKLYWEKGYYWQEERKERKWCLKCNGICRSGSELEMQECDNNSANFEFKNAGKETVQVKVSGTDLCLQLQDKEDIVLKTCRSTENRQKFQSGAGSFSSRRFEFQPVASAGCLTQHHHPARGETLFKEDCYRCRNHDTSFWTKY